MSGSVNGIKWKWDDMTDNVVLVSLVADLVDFSPCAHDPGVVGSNKCDNVNSLLLELVNVFDVWRQMVSLAGWGKGAWRC